MTNQIRHIRRNTYNVDHRAINKTWCGLDLNTLKTVHVFTTIDSAIINRLFMGRITVCSECWDAVERVIADDRRTQESESK